MAQQGSITRKSKSRSTIKQNTRSQSLHVKSLMTLVVPTDTYMSRSMENIHISSPDDEQTPGALSSADDSSNTPGALSSASQDDGNNSTTVPSAATSHGHSDYSNVSLSAPRHKDTSSLLRPRESSSGASGGVQVFPRYTTTTSSTTSTTSSNLSGTGNWNNRRITYSDMSDPFCDSGSELSEVDEEGGEEAEGEVFDEEDGSRAMGRRNDELPEWEEFAFVNSTHKAVYEIAKTEENYVNRLAVLDKASQHACRLLGDVVSKSMFNGITQIYRFHKSIVLKKFRDRVWRWEEESYIGDILEEVCPQIKGLYRGYVSGVDEALLMVSSYCKQNTHFSSAIHNVRNKGEVSSRLSIESHMMEPIQRIPRYELLLKEYLKRIPDDSPDRRPTENGLKLFSEAAKYFNSLADKQKKLKELIGIENTLIQSPLGLNLVSPSRELMRQATIMKIHVKSSRTVPRHVFLFNDLLLLCEELQLNLIRRYRVKDVVYFNNIQLFERADDEIEHSFLIQTERKCLELACRSEQEKLTWKKLLEERTGQKMISPSTTNIRRNSLWELHSSDLGRKAPVFVHFNDVTMCMRCAERFSMLKPKRHCKACGAVVCYSCSQHKVILQYKGHEEGRTCDRCYGYFTDGLQSTPKTPEASSPVYLLQQYLYWAESETMDYRKLWTTITNSGKIEFYKAKQDVLAKRKMTRYRVSLRRSSDTKQHKIKLYHTQDQFYIKDKDKHGDIKRVYDIMAQFSMSKRDFEAHKAAHVSSWQQQDGRDAQNVLGLMTRENIIQAGMMFGQNNGDIMNT